MKVIKKPNIPLQTCKLCGAILKLSPKDMRIYDNGYACNTSVKEYRCKVCNSINIVEWEMNNKKENRRNGKQENLDIKIKKVVINSCN